MYLISNIYSLVLQYTRLSYTFSVAAKTSVWYNIWRSHGKPHMNSSVFLHVFNDISTYGYVFTEYFLYSFSNLSIEFHVVL